MELISLRVGSLSDDFKGISFLDVNNADCKSVVDTDSNELNTPLNLFTLKPELALDPSINSDTADFSANLTLLDSNVQKTGDLLTLKYTEKDWINQPLASRVENVNPFHVIDFRGLVDLTPISDSWLRTIRLDPMSAVIKENKKRTDEVVRWTQRKKWTSWFWSYYYWSNGAPGTTRTTSTEVRKHISKVML